MLISADTFYDQTNLADIRVMSALGITKDDVEAISKTNGVKKWLEHTVMISYANWKIRSMWSA